MGNALREQGASINPKTLNYTTPAIFEILNRLKKVKRTGPDKWIACCPSHGDKSPSLAIRDCNGTILIKCFAGCNANEIVSAIGMNLSDLFPPSDDPKYIKQSRQGFSARQLLHVLKPDLIRLLVIANTLHEVRAISGDYREFISEVILRLNEAISYMDGGR